MRINLRQNELVEKTRRNVSRLAERVTSLVVPSSSADAQQCVPPCMDTWQCMTTNTCGFQTLELHRVIRRCNSVGVCVDEDYIPNGVCC